MGIKIDIDKTDREIIGEELIVHFDEDLNYNFDSEESIVKFLKEKMDEIEYVKDFIINNIYLSNNGIYPVRVELKVKNNENLNSKTLSSKLSQDMDFVHKVQTKY